MITVSELSKRYHKSDKGITNISFNLRAGEITCLAGPNGSGKTTLINTLMGLLPADRGAVYEEGVEQSIEAIRKKMSYIPDELTLIDELTGKEYLRFIQSLNGSADLKQLTRLASLFDLTDDLDTSIASYSHGMRKKLQIVAGLLRSFSVLILDEPCRGLDVEAITVLKRLLGVLKAKGKHILITSHDLLFIEDICDHVLLIKSGQLIANDRPEVLVKTYQAGNIEQAFWRAVFDEERQTSLEKLLQDYSTHL